MGVRLGDWLTAGQAHSLWQPPNAGTLKSKRDRAILAVLLGCGLRRRELSDLRLDHLQRREEYWAIIDLVGKGRHVRTVPVLDWLKRTIDDWPMSWNSGFSPAPVVFRAVIVGPLLVFPPGMSPKSWNRNRKISATGVPQ